MTDARDTDPLPIQPTGSGVADLEVAYEQMKVAGGDVAETALTPLGEDVRPAGSEAESEAHPS